MSEDTAAYIDALSHPAWEVRRQALGHIEGAIGAGRMTPTRSRTTEVNNHIHTWYSFSPYSPSMAAYRAWDAGLAACGIVDHESVGGGAEMLAAGKAFGLGATVGCELRVHFFDTGLMDTKINNPDTVGIAYTVIHGLATSVMSQMDDFLRPIRTARAARTDRQAAALSALLQRAALPAISFADDVLPLSQYDAGGSITERHLLYACAQKAHSALWQGSAVAPDIAAKIGHCAHRDHRPLFAR